MSGDTAFRSYLLLTWRCWGSEVGELLKKRLWFEQTRHWHQWQNIQHFIPEIQGKSRWPPKQCKKRSLYDDDFSLDYLHVDACNIVVADCFKLRHTTACKWDIYNHNAKDLILFIFNISLIYIHIDIHVYSFYWKEIFFFLNTLEFC